MAFIEQTLGVAISGAKGDIGGFKLWQAIDPDIVLYTVKQPTVAKGENDRFQVAATQYREQVRDTVDDTTGDAYKITGGSCIFTVTSAPQFTPQQLAQVTESWRAQLQAADPRFPPNPKFVPLNTRKGVARVLIDKVSGSEPEEFQPQEIGTPGGTTSFLVNLTPAGAQAWIQGIRQKTNIPAGVEMSYEYLTYIPPVGAEVTVHGSRAFDHYSGALKASYDGVFYGGSAQIEGVWEQMQRDGSVEIRFIGSPPEGDAGFVRELVKTFSDQARERLFEQLFAPAPEVKPAAAGSSGGVFGGTNFAFKYRHASEITDLKLTIKFEGWEWLKARMDADVVTLFKDLDDSYVTEVDTETTSKVSLVVGGEERMKLFSGSLNATPRGMIPQTVAFDSEGGVKDALLSAGPRDDITLNGTGRIVFDDPKMPVVPVRQQAQIQAAETTIVFNPGEFLGRNDIYLYLVDENDEIRDDVDEEREHLVVNLAYSYTDTLTNPDPKKAKKKTIRGSTKISPLQAITFLYPHDPNGELGKATFSAFGVVNRKVVRTKAQALGFNEAGVGIMAGPKGIKLLSMAALPEAGRETDKLDTLARRLLEKGMRPTIESPHPEVMEAISREESLRRRVREETRRGARTTVIVRPDLDEELTREAIGAAGKVREGQVTAVEYTAEGDYLWLQANGGTERIRVGDELSDALDQFDEERKNVAVTLDESGKVAERIIVKY
jgi:hypothetical protein